MTDDDINRQLRRTAARGRALIQAEATRLPMPNPSVIQLVGVTFIEGYPENLIAIDKSAGAPVFGNVPLRLVREPDNQYDADAIMVESLDPLYELGHIPAAVAKRLAPDLDAGVEWAAEINEIDAYCKHPWVSIKIRKVYQ